MAKRGKQIAASDSDEEDAYIFERNKQHFVELDDPSD